VPCGVLVFVRSSFSVLRVFDIAAVSGWVFSLLGVVLLPPRTMAATALTTVTPLEVVFFGKDDVAFRREVIVFRIELVCELHGSANLRITPSGNER